MAVAKIFTPVYEYSLWKKIQAKGHHVRRITGGVEGLNRRPEKTRRRNLGRTCGPGKGDRTGTCKREEERIEREKEMKERMDAMQTHMERLMIIVETKTIDEGRKTTDLRGVKLVPVSEKDDIEAYHVTFERIMEAHKIDGARWPHYLAPQLTGRSQLAFAALPSEDSGCYEKIKMAILQRYDINEGAYRRRFRNAVRSEGESNREFSIRMMDWLGVVSDSVLITIISIC